MKSHTQIVEQVKKHKRASDRGNGAQTSNTHKCRAFEAGDYMDYVDKVQFSTSSGQKKRVTVQINKIKPYVNSVKGFLAQNRRKPKYIAQMPEDELQSAYSDYASTLGEYLRNNCNADQVETQQDGDLLMCGIGVVETALTYGEGFASRSANGEVMMTCIDLDTFWYDPTTRETNMMDARYMGVTKEFDLDEALELFADSEEEDFEQAAENNSNAYEQNSDIGSYDRIKYNWADKRERTVHVDFYQWYDIIPYYRADNPALAFQDPQARMSVMMELEAIAAETDDDDFDPRAEILNFNAETKEKLDEAFGEYIEAEKFRKKCFYTAVLSGEKVFTAFKSQHQDGFSLKVKTGDRDQKNKIWTGMVNSMMEPQKYYNKALTELMFVISANSKGGVIVEEDAVEDVEEFEEQYARTDAACVVRPGALANQKIKDKRAPFQPTGYEQIIQLADNALPDTVGIDRTFLGSSENRMETAQLQRQRIRQIVSTLACYVDSICLYQKEHARLMLDLMRIFAVNNRGGTYRILGKDGTHEFIMISDDKLAAEYDVVIEEAPVTPEERQEIADKLNGIGDKLVMAGDIQTAKQFYAFAVKYMQLDQMDAQEIREMLNPAQQPIDPNYVKQLEGLIQELRGEMTQTQIKKLASETALNMEKVNQTRADTQNKAAQTTKTLEEAEQKGLENEFIKKVPDSVSLVI